MENLSKMLNKKPVTSRNPEPINTADDAPIIDPIITLPKEKKGKEKKGKEIKVCVVLPEGLDGFIKDVQFAEILRTGNTKFSYKETLCSIIEYYKNNNAAVPPRPDTKK